MCGGASRTVNRLSVSPRSGTTGMGGRGRGNSRINAAWTNTDTTTATRMGAAARGSRRLWMASNTMIHRTTNTQILSEEGGPPKARLERRKAAVVHALWASAPAEMLRDDGKRRAALALEVLFFQFLNGDEVVAHARLIAGVLACELPVFGNIDFVSHPVSCLTMHGSLYALADG